MFTIWHNPRCMKSRQTLALIEAAGADVTIRKYLEDAPNDDEIASVLSQLGFDDPRLLMRRGEAIYREMGLKSVDSPDNLIKAMVEHPILIERPVVTNGTCAIIARPPETVNTLL